MRIGLHLPIAKGFRDVAREARRLRCDVIQIFLRNPRSWKEKEWTDGERDEFSRYLGKREVYGHLSYLPNIAKADVDGRNLEGLLQEGRLAREMGIGTLVVHCGSRPDREMGRGAAARAIDALVEAEGIRVLLENSAGQGNSLGGSPEDLFRIYEQAEHKEKVALCIDTAHLFAAGYDITGREGWNDVLARIGSLLGPDAIGLLHLNDSKGPLGGRLDRHWHIGHGELGLETFRMIVNDKRIAHLPGVMETPKMGNWDRENMKTIRSLLSPLVSRSPS